MPSFKVILSRAALTTFFLGHFALEGCAQGAITKLPEGADLQLGGSGSAPGKFGDLRDNTFDQSGNLWTLEGPTTREAGDGTYPGNSRIQVFDPRGQFVRQFPLGIEAEPAHIAVGNDGRVFVSFPALDRVVAYDKSGRKNGEFTVPGANGLTALPGAAQGSVAAVGGFKKGRPADRVFYLGEGSALTSKTLSQPLDQVADLSADSAGNLYALANINSIYVFDSDGNLKRTIGAGTSKRAKDGSEVKSSVAVGKDGEIYTLAASYLTRFEGTKVTQREGVFAWYEQWNTSILSVDPSGRVWATSPTLVKSKSTHRFHYRPVVLRLRSDFFAAGSKGTAESSLEGTGLNPEISSGALFGVAFDLKPFRVDVNFPAARRAVQSVDGDYRVYDGFKNVVTQGRFTVPLRDGEAGKTSFTFTPPRYGAYSADVSLLSGGKLLTRIAANFGVTPPYSNLPGLTNEPKVDRQADAARQMFAGLPAMRLSVSANPKSWKVLETNLTKAVESGANVWVQFPDAKDATPEVVRAVAQRFKGRVKVYEIINEPDLKMKPNTYLDILRPAAQAIRQADPQAQIMGPACVNIRLDWYEQFFKGGGARLVNIVSFHDYEGNESIDPNHWKIKIAALRELMKQSGIGNKPLWQTERAITAVRANTFSGLLQAIRINAHTDILQSVGIPPEHNLHYYLNEGGYSSVPSYIWSKYGPHPAVFVMRTRYALTKGLGFTGVLDFGKDGNKLLSGLRYSGDDGDGDGEVVTLRTQGTTPQQVRLGARGATSFRVVDSWGNESTVAANGGALLLELSQLPIYVRVPRGASLTATKLDFGRNIAPQARITYSGETQSDFAKLTDGVFQSIHSGLAGSDNRGSTIWKGKLPNPGIEKDDFSLEDPPALNMTFPDAKTVSTFIFYGLPLDNTNSALIDFDVQARRGGAWQTVGEVRSQAPISEMVGTPPTMATSWATDNTTFPVRLPKPVAAKEWRLVPRRTTFGVAYDAVAARAMKQKSPNTVEPTLRLREIEIFGE
jgi:hypothetical protein